MSHEPLEVPSTSPRVTPESALLSSYRQHGEDDALAWLNTPLAGGQQPQPQQPAQQPQQQQQGSFFGKPGKFIADLLYPPAPVEGAGPIRRTVEKGIETMAGGAKDVGEAVAGTPPTEPQGAVIETPLGNIPVPDAIHRAGKALMGGINATPAGGVIGAAGQTGQEVQGAMERLMPALTDEALKAQIEQFKQSPPLTDPSVGRVSGPQVVQGLKDRIAHMELLLTKPYDERVQMAKENTGQLFELLASAAPMPLFLGAGKLIKTAGGAISGAAREADAAAHAARIEAMRQAGERFAADHAAQQTAKQAEAAAAPAQERLEMLRRDPEAARAMDETIPDARTLGEPGAARVAGKSERERLREQNRTSLEGGELPSTIGHPYPRAAEPLDEQAIKMAQEYDAAVTDPASKPAWDALARETDRMYDEIAQKVKVEKVTGQPYASAEEMNKDIASGHFKVTTDNSEHPFWTVDENWKFRVVHDYLGHFEKNHDFSLAGEKEAYLHHVQQITDPAAKDALQIEIYGQAAANVAHGGEFQPQKAYITKQPFGEIKQPERVTAYHGTGETFDSYAADAETRDGGTWFSTSPETASERALGKEGAPQVRPVSLSLRNVATEDQFRQARQLMQGDTALASELMKSKGYDAVRFDRPEIGPTPNYLVFDANKVAVPLYGDAGKPLETAVEAAKRRIAERFGEFKQAFQGEAGAVQLRGSFTEGWEKNKQLFNDLATVGSAYLWEGTRAFKEWSARMVQEYGEQIVPQLQALYARAQEQIGSLVKKGVASKLTDAKTMLEKAKSGAFAGEWYDAAADEFKRMFGGNWELFSDLIAATSPNTDVKGNITIALKAMEKIMKGERGVGNLFRAEDGFIGAHLGNLNRILEGKPLSGPKVGEFARAIKGDRDAVVVDTWMLRAFGMADMATKTEPTLARVKFIQQAVSDIARELGMDNRQAQAAIWSAQKIASEGEQEIKPLAEMVKDALQEKGLMDREWVFPQGLEEKLQGWVTEEGKVHMGTLFVLGRAAVAGVLGSMAGDSPEEHVRNGLLAAGLGAALSPALARTIAQNLAKPEVRDALLMAVKGQGEEGAIRFPRRAVGENPSPNTARMGATPEAKQLVRGINEKLSQAGKLDRDKVKPWEQTLADAARSPYKTVEAVLGLDAAKLSLDELDGAITAARGVRDAVLEDVLKVAAQAKLTNDPALAKKAVDNFLLAGKVSEQVTNFQTALARGVNVQKMKSRAGLAAKYDVDTLSRDMADMRAALLERGKVSDTQLVEMITKLGDKAATAKIAEAGSKWPPALWNIYYGLNLLSSPLTQVRNVIGNGGALAMAVADRGMGEIIGPVFRAFGAENTVQFGETYQLAKGIMQVVGDTFRATKDAQAVPGGLRTAFLDAYRTGESAFTQGGSKIAETIRTIRAAEEEGNNLPGWIQAMANLGEKNMRFMGGVDEMFKTLTFHAELRALAHRDAVARNLTGKALAEEIERLVQSPTTEMLQSAEAAAHENTFTKAFTQDQDWQHLWGASKKLEEFAQTPLAKVAITPFYRTPMRIAEFSTVHTPGLNFLAAQFYSDMAAGGVKRQMAVAKLMTGSAVVGLVGWYAAHGYITGDWPTDARLKATYQQAGWQPYSIYLPFIGKYVSYQNLEPLSTLVGTVSNTVQIMRDLPEWHASTLMTAGAIAAAQNSLSKTYFQGVSDLVDMIDGVRRGESLEKMYLALENRTTTAIPGMAGLRFIANSTDEERRDRKRVIDNENPELREFDTLYNTFKAFVPGWSRTRPAMVNIITGEALPNENSWLGTLSPWQLSTLKNDPALRELAALGGASLPKELPRAIGGSQGASAYKLPGDEERQIKEGIKLSDEERARLGVILTKEIEDENGNNLHASLADLIQSDQYDDASEQGKKDLVTERFQSFMDRAQAQLRDEYPKLDQAILHRKLLRDLRKLPKSQEDLKEPMMDAVMGSR